MSAISTIVWDELFQTHERFLWGLCYRLTGNAADADDLVQETFVRALKHPPARTDEPWRPWLVRVAVNLGRDLLRRRRRQNYEGIWLPSPIETGDEAAPPAFEPPDTQADAQGNPAARYDMLESVSFAFLLALEALTPMQRAVLLLRDVFDYSVRETADALGITETNVKTTHLRARRAMRAYEQTRCVPTRTLQQQAGRAFERFMQYLRSNDVEGIETLLVGDARALSDGGGEFHAARNPVKGRDKVLLFYRSLVKQAGTNWRVQLRFLNGLPALVTEAIEPWPGYAPRTAMLLGFDADGRINHVYSILASRKMKAVREIEER